MKQTLILHPAVRHTAVANIEVDVDRSTGGRLRLRYQVEAPLIYLSIAGPAAAVRTDGLWQTTCFELFVRVPSDATYTEYNFSPSSAWAAYRFEEYRERSADLELSRSPEIAIDVGESHFVLEADLILPSPWDASTVELGLSAVIEEADGTRSYWALGHPPGLPDFHHPDCFALTLAAPDAL